MLKEYALKKSKEIFLADYLAKHDEEEIIREALGILISQEFKWVGVDILYIACAGLEDANFHKQAEKIEEMIKELEKVEE